MLRVDCFRFYQLGQRLSPLSSLANDALVRDVWFDLWRAKNDLDQFFIPFPLRISSQPATKLYGAILAVVPEDMSEVVYDDKDGNPVALTYRAHTIREAAKEFEAVLAAELATYDTYHVSQKGSFSTPDLIDRADIMLPEGIRTHLSDNAIEDFRQAGRCLAFNLGTAASFHIARSAEEVIRSYYALVIGKVPTVKMRSWGTYHKNLSKNAKSSKKVLGWLEHIKDEYRNPVLHPDEKVSPEAALVFINACSSLIIMMVTEMVRLKESEAQLKLAITEAQHDPAIPALGAAIDAIRSNDEENSLRLEAGTTEKD
jgi:hypothetical protein